MWPFTSNRRHGHIVGQVYLVHFNRRFHGAQHYMGFSTNVPERMKAHRAGRGAPLLAAVTRQGIGWRVVRTWRRKDGHFEQALNCYALRDLCPMCSGPRAHLRGH